MIWTILLPADKAKETDLIFGGEQYEEKVVMDCDPRSFCSACIIRCLFEPGCNFSARQSHSLWHPTSRGGPGAVFVLFTEWESGIPRIRQSPAGIAPARLCFWPHKMPQTGVGHMENTGHEMLSISKSPAPTGLFRQTERSFHAEAALFLSTKKLINMI